MNTLTKAELVQILLTAMKQHGYSKTDATAFVETFFEEVVNGIIETGEVKLPGLGVFRVRAKKERQGRNPKTGEPAVIASRTVVTYLPSQKLKDKLNKNGLPD